MSISVLVLNLNGPEYLDACLSSLEEQVYPRNGFEIRVVPYDVKFGSCVSYNAAIRSCESDFVALLGDDTRVDPQWLVELMSAAERHQAAAVASKILDWTGERIDFAGRPLSFVGHPCEIDCREPPRGVSGEKRLLFPSAVSALFKRAAFLDAGGFDEDLFACFEDVDLGWRLNLLGHHVVLAPKALTYRRPRSTPSPTASARRVRLEERNALAMMYKNYEVDTLARVLPAAVALSLWRGLTLGGIDTLSLEISSRPAKVFDAGHLLVAHLIALEDFCRQLASLKARRQLIQSRRCRSDSELFALFGEPFPHHETGGPYEEIARTLIRDFRIDEILAPPRTESGRATSRETGPGDGLTELTNPSLVSQPKVSIVILTALGPTHLRQCLASLREQAYPPDRIEVIVVDNASAQDPTEEVRLGYPGARVIRNSTNTGFAAGNNIGASAATGDHLVFLNDDTRAHPDWLRELVGTARRRSAAAVASCVLDWSGERIDFVEGAVNFQGKGFQLHYDAPTGSLTPEERPLLFACGAAMLIDRAVFVDAGMWDERAFAYYEDVELGWRLNLLGHHVWFAPRAVVYHKHHGTSGRWAEPPRIRLYERNSLRMLYRLLETKSLERVLPAALLLAADQALLGTTLSRVHDIGTRWTWRRAVGLSRELLGARGINRTTTIRQAIKRLGVRGFVDVARDAFTALPRDGSRRRRGSYLAERGEIPSASHTQVEPLPIGAAAKLAGIYGFLSDLPELSRRRAELQRRRRATDQQVLGRFGSHWLSPSSAAPFQAEHSAIHAALIDEFDLADVISPSPQTLDDRGQDGLAIGPAHSPASGG